MKFLSGVFLVFLASCASSGGGSGGGKSSDEDVIARMLRGQAPRGQLSAAERTEVEKHPLGSVQNPVLAQGPAGENEYLARLRCPEGKQPFFERSGSVAEPSPYGSIMDVYEVVCDAPPKHDVFIDMYHPGYVELRAVPGFTIVAPGEN
jgi:hypothetical protein